jgi:hypothetical protein
MRKSTVVVRFCYDYSLSADLLLEKLTVYSISILFLPSYTHLSPLIPQVYKEQQLHSGSKQRLRIFDTIHKRKINPKYVPNVGSDAPFFLTTEMAREAGASKRAPALICQALDISDGEFFRFLGHGQQEICGDSVRQGKLENVLPHLHQFRDGDEASITQHRMPCPVFL